LRTPPSASGNDAVGAATMPPVGRYVSALRVIAERKTGSEQSPRALQVSDHASHSAWVMFSASKASIAGGAGR
jgi:hypothetical protein